MKKNILWFLFCFILSLVCPLRAQWAKAYGREFGSFYPAVIQATPDGGYIACGNYSDVRNQSDPQSWGWALKLSAGGVVEWMRTYSQILFWIVPTDDGGYAASGWLGIYKLDGLGEIEWKLEVKDSYFWSIQQTLDRGYILSGEYWGRSAGGETGSRILKLSAQGKVEWRREFGIGDHDGIISIKPTPDGGYAAVGNTWFKQNGQGFWIMKISPEGRITWQMVLDQEAQNWAVDFDITPNGDFLVAGYWSDYWEDMIQKIWIMRISQEGQIIAQKYLEGHYDPWFKQICATHDGGSILVSLASVPDFDFHILKLDAGENILWERTFGGRGNDSAWGDDRVYSVCQAGDGSMTILGTTDNLGFIPEPSGRTHTYLVVLNLSAQGDYPGCPYLDITPRTSSQNTNYFLNPLTFGFRDWKLQPIDTNLEIGEFSLNTVENLCAWVSTESPEIKRSEPEIKRSKKKKGGIR